MVAIQNYVAPPNWPIKSVQVLNAGNGLDADGPNEKSARLRIVFKNGKSVIQMGPRGYWACPPYDLKGHAQVCFWNAHGSKLILWFCGNNGFIFVFKEPFFYKVGPNSIALVSQPEQDGGFETTFSRIGSCQFLLHQFLVWDPNVPDRHGDSEAHRYHLCAFDYVHGRIRRVWYRNTKREYLPMADFESLTINPKQDPLREFGLHWTWWDAPRSIRGAW
ncbi:MAG TPA: hypothetical protein VGL56_05295 [Fimbriimonadaceae bacterium]|jgi:hypothetical protein